MSNDLQRIRSFLSAVRGRYVLDVVARRLAMLLAIFASAAAVAQLLFALTTWTGLPAIFDFFCAAVLIAVPALCAHALIRSPSLLHIARRIESAGAEKHGLLSISLELASSHTPGSAELKAAALAAAAQSLGRAARRISAGSRKPLAGALLSLLAMTIAGAFTSPRLIDYWKLPFTDADASAGSVSPGSIAVARGSSVVLRFDPGRTNFPSCAVKLLSLDDNTHSVRLARSDSSGSCALRLDSLLASVVYEFLAGGRAFNRDTIRVIPPPALYRLQVTLRPPAYTGLGEKPLPEGQGSFAAYAGTQALIRVENQFPMREAFLAPAGAPPIGLTVSGVSASGSLQVSAALQGGYSFSLLDSLGQKSDSLAMFSVDLLSDLPPVVRIVKPGADKSLAPEQSETLWVDGADDLGVREMALRWHLRAGDRDSTGSIDCSPRTGSPRAVRQELLWNLQELSLYPGDTVYYWAFARDNKPFGAPQTALSDTFWLRVPGFAEIHRQIAEKEAYAQDAMQDVQQRQESLQDKIADLVKSAKGDRELSWEEKQVLADVAEEIKSQRDSLQKAVQAFEQSLDKLKEQGLSDQELLDKMEQVRKTMEELVRAYGDSVFFEPPKADEKVTWNDLKKSLDNMEKILPDLKERLDNTLHYLELLKKDQQMATLAARAEKAARAQQEMISSPRAAANDLAAERDLLQQQRTLLDEIESRTGGEDPLLDRENLPSLDAADSMTGAMQQEMRAQRMPRPGQMTQASGSLLSLAGELRAQQSSAMAEKTRRERERMLDMSNDALALSQWQHELGQSSRRQDNGPAGDRGAGSAAAQQAVKEALQKSRQKLDSLSTLPPSARTEMAQAYHRAAQSIDTTLGLLGQGLMRVQAPMEHTERQFNAIAQALLERMQDMDNMQGEGSGMAGMMGGLRKLSGKQAALNAMTGELLRQMLGKRSGRQGSEGESAGEGDGEEQRQAQQAQSEIADKLRDLADRYGKEAGGDMERHVKELEQEARRIAEQLRNPKPEVRDRQERFLMRMLESTLSMHKQDEGKEERKSTSARTIFTDNLPIDKATLTKGNDTWYRLRQQLLQGNFPDSYRAAVQAYADSVGMELLK
jgi:hypothetical protein